MDPDAHMRPLRERKVPARVVPPAVEPVGIGEHGRIAVHGGDREAARADPRRIAIPSSTASLVA